MGLGFLRPNVGNDDLQGYLDDVVPDIAVNAVSAVQTVSSPAFIQGVPYFTYGPMILRTR